MAAKKIPMPKPIPGPRPTPKLPQKKKSVSPGAAMKKATTATSRAERKLPPLKTSVSKPLKSGEGYLKPGSMASTKRFSKSKGGDLASERGVMRQARQRNSIAAPKVAYYGAGVVNATYRDQAGKLKNTSVNAALGAKVPKSGYIMMGDTSKKQPKMIAPKGKSK